jgi:hypothetical protein
LTLDSSDYGPSGSAPTDFNVIDTSNLLDHLGDLNIITACATLLRRRPTSTLRTEILVPREVNVADSAKALLSGDLVTVALLLGLKPVQYWMNATGTWHTNASLMLAMPDGDAVIAAVNRPVVHWEPVDTPIIHYDSAELAQLVFYLYLKMFEDEDHTKRLALAPSPGR